MDFIKTLRDVITENEVGSNADLIYCFSDPDGVRTGKSGWSFGRCQFDLQNNKSAGNILGQCGFSMSEINGLTRQVYHSQQMAIFDQRLLKNASVVDAADEAEFREIVKHVRAVLISSGVRLANAETFIHLCDYHNQLRLDYGGRCVRYMQRLDREIKAQDILDCKLTTFWGKKRPDDVQRRFNNVVRIAGDHTDRADAIREGHKRSDG
jgi:hypothetical protein